MSSDANSAGSWAGLRVLVLSPVPTWPVTLGNRNRILRVNEALRREGAYLALLHYPSDEEWRTSLPRQALAAMASQWDEVFLCPVTRPLHTRPSAGEDHLADDWWDPAIGQMLDWLFKVGRYDAFIVNYTWLSKALEHAPPGVLRILDTHDRFSDRRALLAAHGLAPEYFHTTQDQERLALSRADIVWAIKPQEEAFFRSITDRLVRTLPHVEALAPPAAQPPRDGVLRLGIVGGRNNINATNIRHFLAVAEAYLARTLLPVEIVIAGSVCDLLEDRRLSWLRLLGSVESMDELYGAVDVVLAPLAFSTGLKIKVGEALAKAKPVISHAHAFEGYVPTHPFHECPDFEAMMRAVHRLVREPEEIAALAEASRRSLAAAAQVAQATLREAGLRARELPPSAVFVLRFDQARSGSLLFDHVLDAARYAGFRVPVAFHLLGDPAAADPAALRLLATRGRIVVEPEAGPRLGPAAALLFEDLPPRLLSLEALLAAPHLLAWFATLPERLPAGGVRTRLGVCHLGALALDGESDAAARLAALAQAFPRFLVLEETPTREAAIVTALAGAERAAVPLLWRGEESRLLAALRHGAPGPVALITEDPAAPELGAMLACLTTLHGHNVQLFAPEGPLPDWPATGPLAVPAASVSHAPIGAFFAPATWARHRPAFVVEHGRPFAALPAREMALRAGIRHLRFGDPAAPAVAATGPAMSYRARSLISATLILAAMHRSQEEPPEHTTAAEEYGRDAGWARIWGELGRLLAA